MQHPIIDSIGIEIETDCIPRGRTSRVDGFQEDHDASIESIGWTDSKCPGLFFSKPLSTKSGQVTLGTEYKSSVLTLNLNEDIYPVLCKALYDIESKGEGYESKRSGIHVHVCMPYNLDIIKNLFNICAHLEQVFFYLGGMGYGNRGVDNDFAFCRPITKCGPPVIPTVNGLGQCFVLEDLLSSKTIKELFNRYGGISIDNPPNKYTPVRYTWVTIYPLLNLGTVEFRIFNKTLNPNYLYSIVKLCQFVCNTSLRNSETELPVNSIYTPHTKEQVLDTLNKFIYSFSNYLTNTDVLTLQTIIKRTPDINLKENYFYTHLLARNRLANVFNNSYCTPVIDTSLVTVPRVITIHELEGDGNRHIPDQFRVRVDNANVAAVAGVAHAIGDLGNDVVEVGDFRAIGEFEINVNDLHVVPMPVVEDDFDDLDDDEEQEN
jgi:hypothetical protein